MDCSESGVWNTTIVAYRCDPTLEVLDKVWVVKSSESTKAQFGAWKYAQLFTSLLSRFMEYMLGCKPPPS
jgi:hypothetical protein